MTDLAYEPFDDATVLHICARMRASDVEEIFAMRPDLDAWSLYRDLASMGPAHLWFEVVRPAASLTPVALFGVVASSPGTGIAHLIGTDGLTLPMARQIAARIRERVIPAMLDLGLHRVEALSLASHRWAHRFLISAGARREGPVRRAMGKDRQDFQSFVWLADELQPTLPPVTEET